MQNIPEYKSLDFCIPKINMYIKIGYKIDNRNKDIDYCITMSYMYLGIELFIKSVILHFLIKKTRCEK